MASGFSGDIDDLGRLADNLGKLAAVPSRASAAVADNLEEVILEQFAAQADPYGNPWAEHAESTVERWGEHAILDLTGEMIGTLEVAPMPGAGVSVSIDMPAGAHQTGWDGPQGSGPARPILPQGPFPATWRAAVDEALDEAGLQAMGGK